MKLFSDDRKIGFKKVSKVNKNVFFGYRSQMHQEMQLR